MQANSSIGDPISVIAKVARKNTASCAMVAGMDRVCTSRTVAAIEPTVRKIDPIRR